MAESNSLLNCRRGNSTAGSNPALSAIFFAKKMAERRRKSSLHCAKHNFTQKAQPFLHIFTKFQKPCLWRRSISFRLWRGQLALPVKLPPVGGWMCFWLKAHLRCLHGGVAALIFLFPMLYYCSVIFRTQTYSYSSATMSKACILHRLVLTEYKKMIAL